jgi:hypothetical protein
LKFYSSTNAGKVLIDDKTITLNANDSIKVCANWTVTAITGKIITELSNSNPQEFNVLNNTDSVNFVVNTCTPTTSTTNSSICTGGSYYFNGTFYTTAGTYTAHLTNVGGCDSAATLNLTITTSVIQTVSVTASATTICAGTNVTFTATSNNGGNSPTYQWKKNGNNVGTNSNTYSNNALANSDSVWCLLTSNLSCVTTAHATSNKLKMVVNVIPAIGVSSSKASTICEIGTKTSVGNSNPSGGGVWSSSDTTIATVITLNSALGLVTAIANGTATITFTKTSNGCIATASTNVLVNAVPTSSPITGSSSVCVGSSITLSSSTPNGVWSSITGRATVSTGGTVTGTSAGTATIQYTVSNGVCGNNITKDVVVTNLPSIPSIAYSPINTVNPQAGAAGGSGILVCKNRTFILRGTPSGGSWITTGGMSATPISTQDASVNSGSSAGTASITYTIGSSGCNSSRTMNATVVSCVFKGINNNQLSIDNSQLTIYPNPARSTINLNVKTLIGAGTIVVTDLYGKQLKQQTLSMGANTIDVSSFAKGMYLISVITDAGKQTQKVIVE